MINTPYLSTFECPEENPLSEDGHWAQLTEGNPPLKKDGDPFCKAYPSVNSDLVSYSYWTQETFDSAKGDVQAWACIEGGQLGAALETWRVALFQNVGSPQYGSGYLVYIGGAIAKNFSIRRYTSGTFDAEVTTPSFYPERLGIRITDTDVEAWAYSAGTWQLVLTMADQTYRGKFYAVLGIEHPTGPGSDLTMSCFGGGVPRRTQFFRWLYN